MVTIRKLILAGWLIVFLSQPYVASQQADIVALTDLDQESLLAGEGNTEILTLDASNLGTGRDFYSQPYLTIQVGGKFKTFQKVLGDANNNNHFVGETDTGDSVQLVRYISPDESGQEILIGSLVELDTKLVYQFKSDLHDSSTSQVLLTAKVRPSHGFPQFAEPILPDEETADKMVKFHEETLQPDFAFQPQSIIPEDPRLIRSSVKAKSYEKHIDVISLMMVWSRQSECVFSGLPKNCQPNLATEILMLALIDTAVAETNAAYNMSKIPIQLELVHAYRHPTYTEDAANQTDILNVGVFGNTLGRMAIPLDGIMDDVQWKRDKYKADMVSMVIDNDAFCGVGFIGTGAFPAPSAPFMYSVNALDCLLGTYVLAHELGHNMGCAHDRGTNNQCGLLWVYYNHGWRDPGCNFRTIMAYECRQNQCDESQCTSCPTIPRFSSADSTFLGLPLGNIRNDCARHIRKTGPRIARFYQDEPQHNGEVCDPDETACQVRGLLCFAPDVTTVVEGRGDVPMKELQIGDRVLTSGKGNSNEAQYETIYSINHYHKSHLTEFLQIWTETEGYPLELSPHHMVFVEGKRHPVPAREIEVGQFIRALARSNETDLGEAQHYTRVADITSVVRPGFYNILTSSGTVVVNGVMASTYASLPLVSSTDTDKTFSWFSLSDGYISYGSWSVVSQQKFLHMLMAPYRIASAAMLYVKANYFFPIESTPSKHESSSEVVEIHHHLSMYTSAGISLFDWWQEQHDIVQLFVFVLVLLLAAIGTMIEFTVTSLLCYCKPEALLATVLLVGVMSKSNNTPFVLDTRWRSKKTGSRDLSSRQH